MGEGGVGQESSGVWARALQRPHPLQGPALRQTRVPLRAAACPAAHLPCAHFSSPPSTLDRHQPGLLSTAVEENRKLKDFFKVLSLSMDHKGLPYISTMEARKARTAEGVACVVARGLYVWVLGLEGCPTYPPWRPARRAPSSCSCARVKRASPQPRRTRGCGAPPLLPARDSSTHPHTHTHAHARTHPPTHPAVPHHGDPVAPGEEPVRCARRGGGEVLCQRR